MLVIVIDLVGGLFYTTITGSIALAFWFLMGGVLERNGYSRWYYLGLRVVAALFLVPGAYLAASRINDTTSRWHGLLFTATPAIWTVCVILSAIWVLGMAAVALKYGLEAWGLHRRNRKSIPCEQEKQELFDCICKELKIPAGRIRLRQNYEVITAEFMGVLRPQVLLPVRDFSREELRTVLLHELVHYQQKDIYLKYLVMLVVVIHYYNPMAWLLSRAVNRWIEYACDERACRMVGGAAAYFRNIMSVVESTRQKEPHFTACLVEHKHELVERVEHMNKVNKRKKKSVVAAILFSCIVAASSSITVLAASDGLARQYVKLVERTLVEEELEVIEEKHDYVEYTDDGPDSGIAVEMGDIEQCSRSTSIIGWTVPASTVKMTDTFYVKKGQSINVNFYQNSQMDKKFKVGIISPAGGRNYVWANGSINYGFSVNTSGYYRVFVQNDNSAAIEIEGSFTVR